MHPELHITKDGSHTVTLTDPSRSYHSVHGAVQESLRIFIEYGFNHVNSLSASAPFSILEMGFGTGLNALLTFVECEKTRQFIDYTAIEAFPLPENLTSALNYCEQ